MVRYNAAVVGLGRIGFDFVLDRKREQPASHCAAYSMNKRTILAAGVDIDDARRELFHKIFPKSAVFSDIDSLFLECHPDIVSVSVSEESHLGAVQNVIAHRPRLVVLEKPVALNVADGERIIECAKSHNVPVLVNHNRRFADDYRQTKRLIDEGLLGDIHTCNAKLWAGSVIYSRDRFEHGECSLLHDGTHLIDILRFLFGDNFTCPTVTALRRSDRTVKNEQTGETETEKDLVRYLGLCYTFGQTAVNIEISGEKKYFGFELDIIGSRGRIIIGNGYYKVYTAQKSPFYDGFTSLVRQPKYKKFKKTHYFANMVTNAAEFLDGQAELVSTLEDGVGVLRDLTAIADEIEKH